MRKLKTIAALVGCWGIAQAQNRFPKPDFESGYQYPDLQDASVIAFIFDVVGVQYSFDKLLN